MTKVLAALAAILAAGAAAFGGVSATRADAASYPKTGAVYVSGTVRCTHGKWSTVKDGAHAPYGITKVTSDGKSVTVWHKPIRKVGSVQATADNDLTVAGYTTGASVGMDRIVIQFARKGAKSTAKTACGVGWGNVWVTGIAG